MASLGFIGDHTGLACAGWWIYKQLQNDATVITSTGGSTITQIAPLLEIPEWNVALRLDDYTADTSYEFIKASTPFVALSNSQLTAVARTYIECNNVNTAVKLIQARPGDTAFGKALTEESLTKDGIKLGDYYYYIDRGNGCGPGFTNTEVINNVLAIQTRLSELYITAIPN